MKNFPWYVQRKEKLKKINIRAELFGFSEKKKKHKGTGPLQRPVRAISVKGNGSIFHFPSVKVVTGDKSPGLVPATREDWLQGLLPYGVHINAKPKLLCFNYEFRIVQLSYPVPPLSRFLDNRDVKSASTIGPGRGGTSYLTDFNQTWPV